MQYILMTNRPLRQFDGKWRRGGDPSRMFTDLTYEMRGFNDGPIRIRFVSHQEDSEDLGPHYRFVTAMAEAFARRFVELVVRCEPDPETIEIVAFLKVIDQGVISAATAAATLATLSNSN